MDGLDLTLVREFLSPDGRWFGMPLDAQTRIARFLKVPVSGELTVVM